MYQHTPPADWPASPASAATQPKQHRVGPAPASVQLSPRDVLPHDGMQLADASPPAEGSAAAGQAPDQADYPASAPDAMQVAVGGDRGKNQGVSIQIRFH